MNEFKELVPNRIFIDIPHSTSISVCDMSGYLDKIYVDIRNLYFSLDSDNDNNVYVQFSASLNINDTYVKTIHIKDLSINESFSEFNKFYTTFDKFLRYEFNMRKVIEDKESIDFINKSINKMISQLNYVCELKLKKRNLLNHHLNHTHDKLSYLTY